jgi:hypothetical protein
MLVETCSVHTPVMWKILTSKIFKDFKNQDALEMAKN